MPLLPRQRRREGLPPKGYLWMALCSTTRRCPRLSVREKRKEEKKLSLRVFESEG